MFTNPLASPTFEDFIKNVVLFLIYIGIGFFPLMLIYAGYLLVTAEGNPNALEEAKRIFFYSIVGLGIVFMAYGLITLVKKIILG